MNSVQTVPAVEPGGILRVIAPAGVLPEGALVRWVTLLEDAGYVVQRGRHSASVDPEAPYLAGCDEDRAADLQAAFTDPGVDGIVCARGGYGCMRLLRHLDPDSFLPRPLIGFSDVTALHGFLATQVGLASLHGPLLSTLQVHEAGALSSMLRALSGGVPQPLVMDTICEGEAEGRLIGGNLTLVGSLLGTGYFPPLEGAIVFLEEIGESPYRIDRTLTSLMMRGLGKAAGVVFGDMGGEGDQYVARDRVDPCVRRRVELLLSPAGIPVAWGAPIGHRAHNETVGFGTSARLVSSVGSSVLTTTPAVHGGSA